MRELERIVLLRTVDEKWMDHIDAMDPPLRGRHEGVRTARPCGGIQV